jgi:ketosteroid isomerase-like protein
VTDRESADAWVQRYIRAWESNDPDAIGSLFTDNAVYRPTPMSEGWRGRQAIVKGWLERKDDPGTWAFEYEVLAADGDLAVVRGVTRYDPPYPVYENLWLVRLDDRGRASEFIEYWMEHPKPEGKGSAG